MLGYVRLVFNVIWLTQINGTITLHYEYNRVTGSPPPSLIKTKSCQGGFRATKKTTGYAPGQRKRGNVISNVRTMKLSLAGHI